MDFARDYLYLVHDSCTEGGSEDVAAGILRGLFTEPRVRESWD